jgi:hypothetical protein
MALTNAEKQRAFRERMRAAGYRQVQMWVLRKPGGELRKMDRNGFVRKLDELTAGWKKSRLVQLFAVLLKAAEAEAKKEETGKKR